MRRVTGDRARTPPRHAGTLSQAWATLTLLALAGGLALITLLAPGGPGRATAWADAPHIDSANFAMDVDPGSASYLTRAINTAESDGATLLLITMDTPGGDLVSMKTITDKEINATIPIVVYIAPQNARAGSAGTFIALAAPIVAMAPNTRIGAASPIDSAGNDLSSTLDRKIKNDLESQLRSNQTTYGRNPDPAIQTVETAASFTVDQALQQNMVNLEATTQADLLTQLDGKTITLAIGSTVTLHTAGLAVRETNPSLGDRLESLFINPTLLFILFIVAAICIYLELSHPGAIVPGTVGGIALVLFLFGAGSLNPNWTGLALMLLAIALLAVDTRVPTHGVLTVGALISLVVGSLIFFNSGAGRGAPTVNPLVVFAFAAALGLVAAFILQYILRVRFGRLAVAPTSLVGERAMVIEPLGPSGRVRVLGEDWAARLAKPLPEGAALEPEQPVRVLKVDGLTLIVEPDEARVVEKRT
ncbi:MAG TPA: NfeD family protein [Ktedonobacterales bacterium]